jgi:hypothetical protein
MKQKNNLRNEKTRTNTRSRSWGRDKLVQKEDEEEKHGLVVQSKQSQSTTESKAIRFTRRRWYT